MNVSLTHVFMHLASIVKQFCHTNVMRLIQRATHKISLRPQAYPYYPAYNADDLPLIEFP